MPLLEVSTRRTFVVKEGRRGRLASASSMRRLSRTCRIAHVTQLHILPLLFYKSESCGIEAETWRRSTLETPQSRKDPTPMILLRWAVRCRRRYSVDGELRIVMRGNWKVPAWEGWEEDKLHAIWASITPPRPPHCTREGRGYSIMSADIQRTGRTR